MTREQASALLARLLARANPTLSQQEQIARLQRFLGLPLETGPVRARTLARRAEARARREQERREIFVGPFEPPIGPPLPPPPPSGPYVYRRLVEFVTPTVSQRRYHVIRVDNQTQLFGRALETNFNIAISNLRRLLGYSGALWYVDPIVIGRQLIGYSRPPNPLGIYEEDFFPPDDLDDDDPYPDT